MRLGWTAVVIACLGLPLLMADPAADEPAWAAPVASAPLLTRAPAPTLVGARRPAPPPMPTAAQPAAAAADEEKPSPSAAVLRGSVRDERGEPVPGLVVEIRFVRYGVGSNVRFLCTRRVPTNRFGEFACEVPDLASRARIFPRPSSGSGWLRPPSVTACRGGPLKWHFPNRRNVTELDEHGRPWIGPWEEHRGWPEAHLRMERASSLRGRVLKSRGDRLQSADRVTVRATWRHGRLGYREVRQRTDDEGRFDLAVPARAADLEVWVPARGGDRSMYSCGRARRYREPPHPGLGRRSVRPGGPEILFTLPAVHEVRGRVLLEDGTPLALPHPLVPPPASPSARLCVNRLDEDDVVCAPVLYGETSGDFVLRQVPAGRYRIRAWGGEDDEDSDVPRVGGDVVVDVPGPSVRIVCRPTVALEGVVLGDDVHRFWVTWIPDADPTEDGSDLVQCEADGSFRFDDMQDERGTLYVCRRDDPRHGWVEGVRPSQGPVRIPLSRGLTIRGHVEGVRPAEAGRVHVNALQGPIDQDATVEADGRFTLTGLRPGRYDLTAWVKAGRGIVKFAGARSVEAGRGGVRLVESADR